MKITILGSGSSGGVPLIGNYWGECDPNNPKNVRTRVSVLVTLDNKNNILIDTSPDLRMQSISNNIKKIDAVLWTHAHADHANGIDDLRQFLWTRKEQLPVFGSKDTINALKTRFDYVFSQDNSYFKPPLKVNTINEGEFSVCSTKAFAFNQHHGKEFTYGYKVEKFAYSTDVKSFPKSFSSIFKDNESASSIAAGIVINFFFSKEQILSEIFLCSNLKIFLGSSSG